MAGAGGFDDWRFALLTPGATRMVIGAHMGRITKEDIGLFS